MIDMANTMVRALCSESDLLKLAGDSLTRIYSYGGSVSVYVPRKSKIHRRRITFKKPRYVLKNAKKARRKLKKLAEYYVGNVGWTPYGEPRLVNNAWEVMFAWHEPTQQYCVHYPFRSPKASHVRFDHPSDVSEAVILVMSLHALTHQVE